MDFDKYKEQQIHEELAKRAVEQMREIRTETNKYPLAPMAGDVAAMVMNELVGEADGLASFAAEVDKMACSIVSNAVGSEPKRECCEKTVKKEYDGLYGQLVDHMRRAKIALESIRQELQRL